MSANLEFPTYSQKSLSQLQPILELKEKKGGGGIFKTISSISTKYCKEANNQ